jgi:hypothetical protein
VFLVVPDYTGDADPAPDPNPSWIPAFAGMTTKKLDMWRNDDNKD